MQKWYCDIIRKRDINKSELNELSRKVKAISTNGLTKDLVNKFSILNEGKYFSSGIFQNYLIFILAKKYIEHFIGNSLIELWKSNEPTIENAENITKLDSNFAPTLVDHHLLQDINFNEQWLANKIFIPNRVINLYTSYTLNPRNFNADFTLGNCLFGSVNLTKNTDLDKYKYSGYGIGFDSRSDFSFTGENFGKKCQYFWSWYELICK